MADSNQVQKKLNDLLAGIDDDSDDVFLVEPASLDSASVPQPKKDETIIQPQVAAEQSVEGPVLPLAQKEVVEREETASRDDFVKSGDEKDALSETMAVKTEEEKSQSEILREEVEEQEEASERFETKEVASISPEVGADSQTRAEEKSVVASQMEAQTPDFDLNKVNNFFGKQAELNDKIRLMELDRREDQIKMRAMNLGYGYINLRGLPIMPDFLKLIGEEDARSGRLVCFFHKKGVEIRLALEEMKEKTKEVIEKLRETYPSERLVIFLTSEESISAALRLYASIPKRVEKVDDIRVLEGEIAQSSQEIGALQEIQEKVNSASTTEIMGVIIMAAVRIESSDIHIEAEESGIKVRFRIDGVLHDVAVLARETWDHLVSRIKLNAGLKINIKDRPQDGNFSLAIEGRPVDFRVSTLPTNYGESVVMRILYHEKIKKMSLDNLGLDDYNREVIDKEITKPNGLLVITGPTGSGKTTTLYSILNKLNSSDNKIITVEDPIEYKLEGINQSEVREDKGYTFAKALRSLVRQDPDVILVGEIRDEETVDIVLNAALTGHLVLSTIHTNSAAGTIPRFLALGAKPYLLSPAINVAISQRLVRRICPACKEPAPLESAIKERLEEELASLPVKYRQIVSLENLAKTTFYKGRGCQECSGLGYKGQIAIFEVLKVTDEIKQMILTGEISEPQIRQVAAMAGVVSLAQDGILKAARGITSLEEVFRVA